MPEASCQMGVRSAAPASQQRVHPGSRSSTSFELSGVAETAALVATDMLQRRERGREWSSWRDQQMVDRGVPKKDGHGAIANPTCERASLCTARGAAAAPGSSPHGRPRCTVSLTHAR